MSVVNLNAELEKVTNEMGKDIKEKDATIKSLKEELEKANELLKIGSQVHRTDEEIAALSPAAAAASSLLKSGISLSSIYAEHCRVRYVAELIEELDAKAPLFKQQREVYEAALEEIEQLQCSGLCHRELSYTSAELERYQHEHQIQSAQIKRLLFCIEKRTDNMENGGSESDEFLFNNIVELQQRNMELTSKLKRVETEQQQALLNYHSAETESLTNQLNATKDELSRLRQHQSKLELLVEELTVQRDNYKAMIEEGGSRTVSPPTSAANERHSLDKTNSDLAHYKQKAEFLQEKLDCFSADNSKWTAPTT
uniref:Uncharacterized protein n=1 Tax=Ditylenchus dipsaci TaxID=166011 RepID=A0A915DXR5_9BILA